MGLELWQAIRKTLYGIVFYHSVVVNQLDQLVKSIVVPDAGSRLFWLLSGVHLQDFALNSINVCPLLLDCQH